MNLQHARLTELCKGLKLERVGVDWPHLAQQAASGEDSFADFLEKLLAAETDARSERSRQALLKTAALPAVKTLEQYGEPREFGKNRTLRFSELS